MTPIIEILAGIILLIAGRKLFWIAIALIGFLLGFQLGLQIFETQVASWICGAVLGLLGAMLAVGTQSIIIALSGLIMGGYAGLQLASLFPAESSAIGWIFLAVGAVAGLILALSLFEIGLAIMTSIAGAGLIIGHLGQTDTMQTVLYIALVATGIMVQMKLAPASRSRSPKN